MIQSKHLDSLDITSTALLQSSSDLRNIHMFQGVPEDVTGRLSKVILLDLLMANISLAGNSVFI